MALKVLMLRKSITDMRGDLTKLDEKDNEFITREAEIETSINEAASAEERDAVNAAIDAFEQEKADHEAEKASLREKISALEAELAELEAAQEAAKPEERKEEHPHMENREMEIRAQERAAFAEYIKSGRIESRGDDYNMQKGNNGAIIPKTIAQEVIAKVAQRSPLFEMATKYYVKGQLDIPAYPASNSHVISAAYATEFSDLEASSGDFGSVSLTGFLAGALAKISKSLVNNTDVNVVDFVVEQMAESFANFLEDEFINGSSNKIAGLTGYSDVAGVSTYVTATYKSSVTGDDLIDLQGKVIDAYQGKACWIMAPATRDAIRKLKDSENRYLLIPDFREGGTGYSLLGKPVYVSDNMPALGTQGNCAIFYGDFSGLAVKFSEDIDIQVMLERYAPQHAIGVVGWTEVDARVVNQQKLAVLKCGSSDPT